MRTKLMKSEENFSFHLEGESEIDAEILARTINDFAVLTKLVAKEADPEAYIKLNVTAFKNGSFEIDFSTICECVTNIFNTLPAYVPLANDIINSIIGIFKIKKFLKGKKASKIQENPNGTITVFDSQNNSVETPKNSQIVFQDNNVEQLIINISNYATEHNPKGGFSLGTKEETHNFSSEDLKNIAKYIEKEPEETLRKVSTKTTNLLLKTVDLMGNSKWKVYDEENKAIDVSICDEKFLADIHNKKVAIQNQDYINAVLEISVDLSETGLPVSGTEQYRVIQVNGDIQHDFEQIKIKNA